MGVRLNWKGCLLGAFLDERIGRHHRQPQLSINRRGRRTGESRAFWYRIWLASCPISRADSNTNMPPYAEHASLQRIKSSPFRPSSLSPELPCSLLPLVISLGALATRIGVCYVGSRSYALV